jgi:preprotein translocase subunit SecA
LLDSVKNEVTKVLMTVQVQSTQQLEQAAEAMEARAQSLQVNYTAPTESGEVQTTAAAGHLFGSTPALEPFVAAVGRNEPCPCGSGKKYKFCHGKLS